MAISWSSWSPTANSQDSYPWGWAFRVGVEVYQRQASSVSVSVDGQEKVVSLASATFIQSGYRNVAAQWSAGSQSQWVSLQWSNVYLAATGGEAYGEARWVGSYTADVGSGAGEVYVGSGHGIVSGTQSLNVDVYTPDNAAQAYSATYDPPNQPRMTSFARSGGYSALVGYDTGAAPNSPVVDVAAQWCVGLSDSLTWEQAADGRLHVVQNEQGAVSNPATVPDHRGVPQGTPLADTGCGFTAFMSARAAYDQVWRDTGWALFLAAPKQPTGLTGEPLGKFGVSLSWENEHPMGDYVTEVWAGGTVSVSDGALYHSGSTKLGEVGRGVSTFSDEDAWGDDGYSEKTFYVVQRSSYDQWPNPSKASFVTSGFRVDGLYCQPVSTAVTNGAERPQGPTGVVATNVFDGRASDTRVDVSWTAPADDPASPRDGFRENANGEVAATVGPDATSATLTLPSFTDMEVEIAVASYGVGGESVRVANSGAPVCGPLSEASFGEVWRGWDEGRGSYVVRAEILGTTPEGAYAHDMQVSVSRGGGEPDVYRVGIADGKVEFVLDEGDMGEGVGLSARYFPTRVQEAEPYLADYAVEEVARGPLEVPWIGASQQNFEGLGFVAVEFAAPDDPETDLGYRYSVTFSGDGQLPKGFEVDGDGESETYSNRQQFMGGEMVYVDVVPTLNGWSARPTQTRYRYHPLTLRPPTLLSLIQVESGLFELSFTDASGGAPYGDVERVGYRYRVYVEGEAKGATPGDDAVVYGGEVHRATFSELDPYDFRVWVTSLDSLGNESRPSNSLWGRYNPGACCLYAYGCDLYMQRVEMDRSPVCLSAQDSHVAMSGCRMNRPDGGLYYSLSDGSTASESDGRFGE